MRPRCNAGQDSEETFQRYAPDLLDNVGVHRYIHRRLDDANTIGDSLRPEEPWREAERFRRGTSFEQGLARRGRRSGFDGERTKLSRRALGA